LIIKESLRYIYLILDSVIVACNSGDGGDVESGDSWNWIGWISLDGSGIGIIVVIILGVELSADDWVRLNDRALSYILLNLLISFK